MAVDWLAYKMATPLAAAALWLSLAAR